MSDVLMGLLIGVVVGTLCQSVEDLLRRLTRWFLRNTERTLAVEDAVTSLGGDDT